MQSDIIGTLQRIYFIMFEEIESFRIAGFVSLHDMQHQETVVSARLVRAQFCKSMDLITARKRSCGKVMFSQASICSQREG